MTEWTSYNTWAFIVNLFIAIGTCGAVIFALLSVKKPKEKLKGFYWAYYNDDGSSMIRVHLENNGNHDCVLDKENTLFLMRRDNSGEDNSYGLNKKIIIPSKWKSNINFYITNSQYVRALDEARHLVFYIRTENGTIIKLNPGMKG